MKISKVKQVQGNGTYESQFYGLLYKYEYTLEDGTVLTANHKTQKPFEPGSEVEYEIRGSNDFGSYGAVRKPKKGTQTLFNPSPTNDKGVKVGHAINVAFEVIKAQGKIKNTTPEVYIKELAGKILKISYELENEYDSIVRGENNKIQQNTSKSPQPGLEELEDNNLPF